MIAFLGTGHLGGNFTRALLAKGETVHVWNRTIEKAKALEEHGAKVFDSPGEAVKGVHRVHIVVSDDDAVNEVLALAEANLEPGSIIIDHTTTTVEGAIERTVQWAAKGHTYVHVPVFMGPSNALDSTGYMLISDNGDIAQKIMPWLETMTGKVLNFGNVTGKAAGVKLIGNQFLLALTAGISDMLSLAKAVDVTGEDIFTLLSEWNPGASTPQRLRRVLNGQFDTPSWELQMARKDARLMIEEAARGGREVPGTTATAQQMDKWIAAGNAKKDWMIIASGEL
ncbi:MAG: NAD(P)-dependent oxidoreductase [Chitinophagales bacterium]|nr:NAD(P)-dependent oxidoreductase [Chitinophagales bacterium]